MDSRFLLWFHWGRALKFKIAYIAYSAPIARATRIRISPQDIADGADRQDDTSCCVRMLSCARCNRGSFAHDGIFRIPGDFARACWWVCRLSGESCAQFGGELAPARDVPTM